MTTVLPIDTPGLGDRTYLAHDGRVALVVDPQRDYDRVLAVAEKAGVHDHPRLRDPHPQRLRDRRPRTCAEVDATYHVNGDDPVSFERTPISDGDVVEVGEMSRARGAHSRPHPHPPVVRPRGRAASRSAVFTGGSLLFGSTGRPDLLGPDHTDALVHAQCALGPAPGSRAARRGRRLPDPRLRQLLLRHPVRGASLARSARRRLPTRR